MRNDLRELWQAWVVLQAADGGIKLLQCIPHALELCDSAGECCNTTLGPVVDVEVWQHLLQEARMRVLGIQTSLSSMAEGACW